jgi:hypothetical protein
MSSGQRLGRGSLRHPSFTEASLLETLPQAATEGYDDRRRALRPWGKIVGVEFLYPRTHGMDGRGVRERCAIDLEIPFSFAA